MTREKQLTSLVAESIGYEVADMIDRLYKDTSIKKGADDTMIRYWMAAEMLLYYLLENKNELHKLIALSYEYWKVD